MIWWIIGILWSILGIFIFKSVDHSKLNNLKNSFKQCIFVFICGPLMWIIFIVGIILHWIDLL